MKRTQIQLPDDLFEAAHHVAEGKEISMTELVRRGLEYMIAVTPVLDANGSDWKMPEAKNLGADDPFQQEDWREKIHLQRLLAAEEKGFYRAGDES